jgi:hypothetical protein
MRRRSSFASSWNRGNDVGELAQFPVRRVERVRSVMGLVTFFMARMIAVCKLTEEIEVKFEDIGLLGCWFQKRFLL